MKVLKKNGKNRWVRWVPLAQACLIAGSGFTVPFTAMAAPLTCSQALDEKATAETPANVQQTNWSLSTGRQTMAPSLAAQDSRMRATMTDTFVNHFDKPESRPAVAEPSLMDRLKSGVAHLFDSKTQSTEKTETKREEKAQSTAKQLQSARWERHKLYFESVVGKVHEISFQSGKNIAAHIYADAETPGKPYLFFATPSANGGLGLWFNAAGDVSLKPVGRARGIQRADGLWGAEVRMKSDAKRLNISDAVLGNMRFVRDRELNVPMKADWRPKAIKVEGNKITFWKPSLDGNSIYQMEIEVTGRTRIIQEGDVIRLESPDEVTFVARGMHSEEPVTPMRAEDVFRPEAIAGMNKDQLNRFLFLIYDEVWAAGAPRYFSNFGRDRLIMLNSMMHAMKPEAVEKIFLTMMSGMHRETGMMSHEQNLGDFSAWERKSKGEEYVGHNPPIEDYVMVDDDFLFSIVFNKYLRQNPERAADFLKGKDRRGIELRELAEKNIELVRASTDAFANNPSYKNLISFKEGKMVGQWRDSENLGKVGGVYAFDVNGALVPGALKGLADSFSDPKSPLYNKERATQFGHMFEVWNTEAPKLFEVTVSAAEARTAAEAYLKSLNIPEGALSTEIKEDITFSAIALDKNGQPIRVMHSDDTMMMAFGHPSEAYLRQAVGRLEREFPYGLNTRIAMLVANPVFASPEIQKAFTEKTYHGRVSWLMQEILWYQGAGRQITRTDLPADLREALRNGQRTLAGMIKFKSSMGNQEVYAINFANGTFVASPFAGDAKSNSNQGWSHLDLAQPIEGMHE